MCVIVTIDGREVDRLQDLDRALGGEAVLVESDNELNDRDCCLCPVDLEATADKFGYSLREDKDDYMWHWFLTRNTKLEGTSSHPATPDLSKDQRREGQVNELCESAVGKDGGK